MGRPTPDLEGLGYLLQRLEEIEALVRGVSGFDGTQLVGLVDQVRAALADLTNQVAAEITAQSMTRAEIQAGLDSKAPTSHSHDQGQVTGSWSKAVDNGTGGTVRTGDVYAAQSPFRNITGGRVATWTETATGMIGTASSSRRYKQDIEPLHYDPALIVQVEADRFRYIEQVEQFGERARVEPGFMAEQLHSLGLHAFVVYRDLAEVPYAPRVVPDGVDYVMWAVALQHAVRWLHERVTALETVNDQVEARLAALEQKGIA